MRLGLNLLLVAAFVVASWLVLESFGFEMALMASLVISVVLTLLLNLVMRATRRRAHSS